MSDPRRRRTFLTAQWRYLAMINYRVDPAVLRPYVPAGTELDLWQGDALLSAVGFIFLDTRVCGVSIPFHSDFEEVNLRFYVRADHAGEVRHGVTFIRELVPRRAIALLARAAYNEPYVALPMRSHISLSPSGAPTSVSYGWRSAGGGADDWCGLSVALGAGEPAVPPPESEASFATEHYWGYTRQRDGGTMEYEVEHPRWRVWPVTAARLDGDLTPLCPPAVAESLRAKPRSACLAEGSAIKVFAPRPLAP